LIPALYEENCALLKFIDKSVQPSLYNDAENKLKKGLIMSIASHFENRILTIIRDYVARAAKADMIIVSLVEQKALTHQYFTYFEWSKPVAGSINNFLRLFGAKFLDKFKLNIIEDPKLKEAVEAFLSLGGMRNGLAHKNYALYPIDKTSEEIYALYLNAKYFVDSFEKEISRQTAPESGGGL